MFYSYLKPLQRLLYDKNDNSIAFLEEQLYQFIFDKNETT